jgi:hypothetical protein
VYNTSKFWGTKLGGWWPIIVSFIVADVCSQDIPDNSNNTIPSILTSCEAIEVQNGCLCRSLGSSCSRIGGVACGVRGLKVDDVIETKLNQTWRIEAEIRSKY